MTFVKIFRRTLLQDTARRLLLCRQFAQEEPELVAKLLPNSDNVFTVSLEKRTLKKLTNNEVSMHFQQEIMKAIGFAIEMKENNSHDKNIIVLKYNKMNTGIDTLRVKYKALQPRSRRIAICIKNLGLNI